MKLSPLVAALLISVTGVLAGCDHGHRVTITIRGMSYDPPTLTVAAGDSVMFDNQDTLPHTATDRGVFDSGPIAAHTSWGVLLAKPGDYPFTCTLHPQMSGRITVR